MKILAILLAMFLVCWACGAMLSSLFARKDGDDGLCAAYGYAYTTAAFYALYMTLYAVELACLLVFAVPALLAGGLALSRRMRGNGAPWRPVFPKAPDLAWPAALGLVVVLLAAWPFLYAGYGHYWHSGNYDLDDGLRGREAYLEYHIRDRDPFDIGEMTGDKSWVELKKLVHAKTPRDYRPNEYREWYAGDNFRFQYSSIAFWSGLFRDPYGMDITLIQMLLGLVLMTTGIFSLCKASFSMSPRAAAATALCATCNVFYLNTYFSGHIGSMMYGAFAPALLQLGLQDPATTWGNRRRLFFMLLLVLAITYSYPHPLVILAVPVVLYHLLTRERMARILVWLRAEYAQRRGRLASLLLASLALAALCGLGLWHVTEGYRLFMTESYRAWGYALHPLILPLLLGLLPAPVVGARFLGNMLTETSYLALIAVAGVSSIALVWFYVRYCLARSRFLLVFGLCWVGWYLFLLFFITDSYYLYKFLYTQQFLLVIGIAGFVAESRSTRARLLVLALVLSNLACVVYGGRELAKRPYNAQPDRYEALLKIPPDLLRESFLDLTSGDRIAVRQLTRRLGIPTKIDLRDAKFFVLPTSGTIDITSSQHGETVADAQSFVLRRTPEKNFLFVRTWFDQEIFEADQVLKKTSFRWVGHGKNDYVGIFVARPSAPEEMRGRFLRICFQKGPSAVGPIDLSVTTADMRLLHRQTLQGNEPSCVWIPAEQVSAAALPLIVSSGARGRSILPYDDRILLYRVFEVGWTDRLFDPQIAPIFNAKDDILVVSGGAPSVWLRLGWEALERTGAEHYRWVGRAAEIALNGAETDARVLLELTVEPGPSQGTKPCVLEFLDQAGTVVHRTEVLSGRTVVRVPLTVPARRTSVFTIRTDSDNVAVPGERRLLNFRVFRIDLAERQ